MARTKASVGSKVASAKSSKARCSAAPPPSSSGSSGRTERSSLGSGGGNPACPRETPVWQKPITNFFCSRNDRKDDRGSDSEDVIAPGPSKSKPKRNMIESDDEDQIPNQEKPKNTVLDETIDLEPLNGESSHKIVEYYGKNGVKQSENGVRQSANGVKQNENEVKQSENGENNVENEDLAQESGKFFEVNVDVHMENETSERVNRSSEDLQNTYKGKGKGKKTNKENLDSNIERRKSVKRDLEEITFGEEPAHVSKRVKVV